MDLLEYNNNNMECRVAMYPRHPVRLPTRLTTVESALWSWYRHNTGLACRFIADFSDTYVLTPAGSYFIKY